ncbi:MAG: FG-GAP-like repeat-containing protein [Phycisphaeraceae bacterium]
MVAARFSVGLIAVAALHLTAPSARAQFVFDPPVNFSFDFDAWPTSIGLGDLNGDGLLDAVVTGRNVEGIVLVMMGSAGGGFEPAVPLELEAQTDWVVVERLDADPHLDLAIALRSGVGKIAVFKGNGDGTFGGRVDYSVGRGPSHIAAQDFDGDGDIDLAVMDNSSETVTILRNDGSAVFTPSGQINHVGRLTKGISGAIYLTAADFDGDNDVDIAVAKAAGYISVLANNGDATFARSIDHTVGTATGIAAGDVDSDGDIDIVFGDLTLSAPGFLGVLHNQGNGNFAGVTKFPVPGNTMWYVALADLNGDGLPDAIISDAFGQKIFLFENQTVDQQLSFAAPQPIGVDGFPRSVFPVDLDGDCDLDLLVASITAHQVQVLINETPQEEPCRSEARFSGASSIRLLTPAQRTRPAPPALRRRNVDLPNVANLVDLNRDGKIDAADLARLVGARPAGPTARAAGSSGCAGAGADCQGMKFSIAWPTPAQRVRPPAHAEAGDNPACGPGAGNCFIPHNNPGCDLEACCLLVCEAFTPFCCELLWDSACAAQAQELCDTSITCPGEGNCYEPHPSPSCADKECCAEVCEEMPTCCQLEWTEECAGLAFDQCPCGAPGSGNCFDAHETPGCEDQECCGAVCRVDGFCCAVGWDEICVEEASQFCGVPACGLQCPAGALVEDEICGEEINGGCNANNPHDPDNPAFTPISCGDTFCGTAFAAGTRDTDWYEVTVTEPTQLSWTVSSEFPASMIIVAGHCDTSFGALTESFTTDCAAATASTCVAPGTYYLFVSTGIEVRTERAGAPCPSCAEDLNGDGVVGPFDLAVLLGAWGPCDADCPEDFNEDATVNPVDLAVLLGAWGPCDRPPDALWGNDYVATLTCEPCGE